MEKAIAECDVDMSVTRKGSLLNIHFSKEAPDKKMSVAALGNLEEFNSDVFPAHRGLFVISTITTEAKIGKVITV